MMELNLYDYHGFQQKSSMRINMQYRVDAKKQSNRFIKYTLLYLAKNKFALKFWVNKGKKNKLETLKWYVPYQLSFSWKLPEEVWNWKCIHVPILFWILPSWLGYNLKTYIISWHQKVPKISQNGKKNPAKLPGNSISMNWQ